MNNHRIQQWLVPVERPAYVRSFGSQGTGDGKFWLPTDVAVGVEGNLLVVDKGNNRIQRFDQDGKYLGKFGSFGTGDGQFSRPTAIAVDRDGNLLVTDSDNNRIQKFSPEGAFITKFGSAGTGNGKLFSPEGIAADFEGNVWVADTYNGRIQKFDEEGKFLAVVGSKGSGTGQLGKPIGIDVDSEGKIWVGDYENHRVSVFEGDGDFFGQFGSLGTGPGQFNRPSSVEIDARDNVWVADQVNGRVQRFDLTAKYVGQFGSAGTGEGQFSFPMANTPVGIAADRGGRIWVADVNGYRIQQWMLGHYAAEAPAPLDLSDGDPKVVVQTPGGLVSSVTGNAAGQHTYGYEGGFLTSHNGPEGKTLYKKNAAGLLSEVILANGTWAKIKYYADKRVESVEVAPNGAGAKMTKFSYEDGPPRRTTVSPSNQPQIVYDIGADGSVLKWWHKDTPPEIIALNGSLGYDKNGKEVAAGDLVLEVEGDSTPAGALSSSCLLSLSQALSLAPSFIAISPDGTSLYVTSSHGSTIGEFRRNRRDGALRYKGCLSAANRLRVEDPCRHIPRKTKPNLYNGGLEGVHEIAVTPDGTGVYGASFFDNAVFAFARNPVSGRLSFSSFSPANGTPPGPAPAPARGFPLRRGTATAQDSAAREGSR